MRRFILPVLALALGSAAFAPSAALRWPPWLSIESPVNPFDNANHGALFLVHALTREGPSKVGDLTGTAQGLVNGVKLRHTETNQTKQIELDGVFVAIGHDPNSTVFKGKLNMDENGYLKAEHGGISNVPGVFIAGDVQDHRYRQAVTAAGSGCMAAIDAEKFLEEHKD